jgi:transcriptional regulator with XRE-family HTH domain
MEGTRGQTLGEILRDARVKSEVTLRDLAKTLDLAPSYLSDIENDRRVPSEEVLIRLAEVLRLRFDNLMALAGRVGDDAERYLKKHPAVGALFRRISDKRLSDEDLKKLNSVVEKMGSKKRGT